MEFHLFSENDKFSEWKIQRFLCWRVIERKQEFRYLHTMAKGRSAVQTNRFIALSISETILHNWWIRYHDAVYEIINDPLITQQRRIDVEDDLLATGCCLYETKYDLKEELQKIIDKHHYQLMVRKLFDPYEPYITQQFLLKNNIIKKI
jgi:hypothetical protein